MIRDNRTCRNPHCEKTFYPYWINQLYCTPKCNRSHKSQLRAEAQRRERHLTKQLADRSIDRDEALAEEARSITGDKTIR